MIYDSMSVNPQGDVSFHLGSQLVAVAGSAYNLNDYVIICKVNGKLEHLYIRVGATTHSVDEKTEIARAILTAYLTYLVGNDKFTCEFITQGFIKLNEDPFSLNQHITINSKLIALVIKSDYSKVLITPTTVALQSTIGSVYMLDIMDGELINALGVEPLALIATASWLCMAYEQWRNSLCI